VPGMGSPTSSSSRETLKRKKQTKIPAGPLDRGRYGAATVATQSKSAMLAEEAEMDDGYYEATMPLARDASIISLAPSSVTKLDREQDVEIKEIAVSGGGASTKILAALQNAALGGSPGSVRDLGVGVPPLLQVQASKSDSFSKSSSAKVKSRPPLAVESRRASAGAALMPGIDERSRLPSRTLVRLPWPTVQEHWEQLRAEIATGDRDPKAVFSSAMDHMQALVAQVHIYQQLSPLRSVLGSNRRPTDTAQQLKDLKVQLVLGEEDQGFVEEIQDRLKTRVILEADGVPCGLDDARKAVLFVMRLLLFWVADSVPPEIQEEFSRVGTYLGKPLEP
jgi:hypothetical protein